MGIKYQGNSGLTATETMYTTEAQRHGEKQKAKAKPEHTEVAEDTEAGVFRVTACS